MAEPRLLVDATLGEGLEVIPSSAQAHYLTRVMRLGPGSPVRLFNGRDGEWRATLAGGPAELRLAVAEMTRPQLAEPGPILGFAPIRRQRVEWLVEKAVELGAAALRPVRTRRAEAGLGPGRRLEAIIVEAAEQCGRLSVPPLMPEIGLAELLAQADRPVLALDTDATTSLLERVDAASPPLLLVGPEGGFDDHERALLAAHPRVTVVRLVDTVLRAETAALAGLAVWGSAVRASRAG